MRDDLQWRGVRVGGSESGGFFFRETHLELRVWHTSRAGLPDAPFRVYQWKRRSRGSKVWRVRGAREPPAPVLLLLLGGVGPEDVGPAFFGDKCVSGGQPGG